MEPRLQESIKDTVIVFASGSRSADRKLVGNSRIVVITRNDAREGPFYSQLYIRSRVPKRKVVTAYSGLCGTSANQGRSIS